MTSWYNIHCVLYFLENRDLQQYGKPAYYKLQKLEPVLTYMNNKFSEIFTCGNEQSIDKAVIPIQCLSMKQYLLKSIHHCFKIWSRADAITGYICEFDAYTC